MYIVFRQVIPHINDLYKERAHCICSNLVWQLFHRVCNHGWLYISAVCDSSLSVEEHVKASCKSAFFHLSNIAQMRKHLPARAAETLIHSYVTSKVDFCNSLLYGVPKLRKLQSIQNSVARLFNNYSSSPNGLWIKAHEAEGRMGYWLRGHESERNNCFSKIQLVGRKYQE